MNEIGSPIDVIWAFDSIMCVIIEPSHSYSRAGQRFEVALTVYYRFELKIEFDGMVKPMCVTG